MPARKRIADNIEVERAREPKLLVVILNYRTPDLAVAAARSLEAQMCESRRVVVVDGGSADGSAEKIAAGIAGLGWAELLALDVNGGFSYGNNAAIRRALAVDPPDFVFLQNPDTVATPGALDTLIELMLDHPDVGIAGARLQDPDGTPQRTAFRFDTPIGQLLDGARLGLLTRALKAYEVAPPPPETASPVDWVAGAAMMIRRPVFEQIGLLDENYFLYFEELDFCLNARRAGWRCWYVPEARIVHYMGQATKLSDERRTLARRPRYWFDSRAYYFEKNFGRGQRLLADVLWASAFFTYRLRQKLLDKPDRDPPQLLRDFVRYNFVGRRA